MKKIIPFACLIILHLLLASQLQFTPWPEMLAYPYLLQKGFNFYQDIVHPYLPLLPYLVWGVSSLFGLTVATIQGVTYVFIVVIDLLLILIMKRWFNRWTAFLLFTAYIGLQLVLDGNGLWFDLAATPFILAAMYVFNSFMEGKKMYLYVSAVLLGIALLIKQTVLAFILYMLVYLLFTRRIKESLFYILVTFFPFVSQFLYFHPKDLFEWGVLFPLVAAGRLPGYILMPTIKQLLVTGLVLSPLLWIVTVRDKHLRLTASWSVLALTFTFPRFDYFHLQPLLPLLVLILGFAIMKIQKIPRLGVYLVLYLILVGGLFIRYFTRNYHQPPRFFSSSTFDAAMQLSQKLPDNQPIYFYNTTANYFVAANLLPVKPWVDTFPWYLEIPGIQERIVASLEDMRVEWVVATDFTPGSRFSLGSYRPQKLDDYIQHEFVDYDRVGSSIRLLKRRN